MTSSVPVYTTETGGSSKSALSRTSIVLDNEPTVRIIKPRIKKQRPKVETRRTALEKHIKPEKLVMDAAKRITRGLEVDGKKWPRGYYNKIQPIADDIVIVR